jgi:hypothetical protein
MDRINTKRNSTLIALSLVVLIILLAKASSEGWLRAQPTIELGSAPTLIFFNGDKGCECELLVYRNASEQMAAWNEVDRGGLAVVQVSIHVQGDLKRKYKVIRAPTLLLLDAEGEIILRQDNVVSDEEPLDLASFEAQIKDTLVTRPD